MTRTLFDPPTVEPARENNPQRLNLREEFEKWHRENPGVYRLFEKFALTMSAMGKPFGAKFLAERVRWECYISARDDYAVNNNLTAYIARRLVQDHPELWQFLRFRRTKY